MRHKKEQQVGQEEKGQVRVPLVLPVHSYTLTGGDQGEDEGKEEGEEEEYNPKEEGEGEGAVKKSWRLKIWTFIKVVRVHALVKMQYWSLCMCTRCIVMQIC